MRRRIEPQPYARGVGGRRTRAARGMSAVISRCASTITFPNADR
ncbi:hypothetical protein [Streptomyces sp. AN091965]|nr:hypothetical protein [Streptomyces sp. AN091965]